MFFPILAMHIPDGFLNLPVSLLGWLLSGMMIVIALGQTRNYLGERQVPMMGVLAAFVFAAQMINFPVAGGTSGHLLGATLAAILLGPWATVLVLTSVVAVQGLLFQDGGVLALGFNIFNMGIIGAFVGSAVYHWVYRTFKNLPQGQLIGAAAGAWASVELAALATTLELVISGTSPLDVVLPAMVGIHALIGIGEALITVGALAFIRQTRPDLLGVQRKPLPANGSGWIAVGLIIALVVVLFSPLANPNPDGLERVAEDKGFTDLADSAPYEIMPDYTVSFIDNEALTTIAAGTIGTLIVAGIGFGMARVNRRKQTQRVSDAGN